MAELALRAATADDEEFLYDVHRQALGEVVEATWGRWDDDVQRQFHRDWFDPAQVEIVLVDDRPVGMIQAGPGPAETYYISRIEVLPELQSQGVGTALMRQVLARAREAGATVVELHVLELNRARRLYERLGFRVVAEEPPKLRMRLELH